MEPFLNLVKMNATLNNLEVNYGDILNAYVQTTVTENVQTTLGPEFGKYSRKLKLYMA